MRVSPLVPLVLLALVVYVVGSLVGVWRSREPVVLKAVWSLVVLAFPLAGATVWWVYALVRRGKGPIGGGVA